MSPDVVQSVLLVLAAYVAIGVIVAVPLVIFGLSRIDPAAKAAPWMFRVLVLPGVVTMWPLLLRRVLRAERPS